VAGLLMLLLLQQASRPVGDADDVRLALFVSAKGTKTRFLQEQEQSRDKFVRGRSRDPQ